MRIETRDQCLRYFDAIVLKHIPEGWVAGGAVRDWVMHGYAKSDIDLFFKSPADAKNASEAIRLKGGKLAFKNNNKQRWLLHGKPIDIVLNHFFGGPGETIEQFDFTVCCAAVDRTQMYTHAHFFEDVVRRRLVLNSLPFPLSTLERMQRYINKGFRICNGGLLDIVTAIQALDMKDKAQNSLEFYPDGTPRFAKFD